MATTRPFAYNTGSTISGTIQMGNIAIGVSDQDYSQNPGGVKWWMGPDEELGYVIANEVPTGDHPTQVEVDASINFWRSTDLTDQSFIDLLNSIPITNGLPLFTNVTDAQSWLSDNNYFTSYGNCAPSFSLNLGTIALHLRNFMPDFRNPDFYEYGLDGDGFYIEDGGNESDMYDDGNATSPWLLSNVTYTGDTGYNSGESNYPYAINYQTTGTTGTMDTSFSYISLGYESPNLLPLTVIGTRTNVGEPVGFQCGGNIGADGSGTFVEGNIYTGDTVSGFTVHSYYRQTYDAGDPSVCDVFILLGHSCWDSVFGDVFYGGDSSNSGCGSFLYTSGNSVNNILAIKTTLSKDTSIEVTFSEVKTVVDNFISRISESQINPVTPTPTPTPGPTDTPTPTPTPGPTDTPTPTPTPTLTPTPTPAPTDTPTPTPTETEIPFPTDTPTPTPTPCNHPYQYQLSDRTNITDYFNSNLSTACQALECLTNSTCLVTSSFNPYFDNETPQIGDYFYNSSSICNTSTIPDGYYVMNLGVSGYTLIEVLNSQIVSFPICGTPTPTPTLTSTPTPTPTNTPTSTPTVTPTSTPTLTPTPQPLDFTISYDCASGGRIITTSFVGGSGQYDESPSYFTTEALALAATYFTSLANPNVIAASTVGSDGTYWKVIRDRNNQSDKKAKSVTINCAATPTPTPTVAPTATPTPQPTDTPTPTPIVSTYYTIEVSQLDLDDATGSGANNNRIRVRYYDDSNVLITTYFTVAGTFVNEICVKGGTSVELLYYKSNIPVSMINSTATDTLTACGASAPTPTPTVEPTATPTPNPTDTPTPTPTVAPTDTPTPLPATSTPTPTPTVAPTDTPTPNPTDTPTPTPTVGATSTPTPTPTSGGSGVGSWYFYSDEGNMNAFAPVSSGNTIFTINTGTTIETFNPNKIDGVSYLYFNTKDSSGDDYISQFGGYTGGTGTITISQNGDTATYTSTTSGSFSIENIGGGTFFKIDTNLCTQTKTSNAPYVYADPISIAFNSLSSTPTPTPSGPTSTPTPTPTGGGSNSWYFYTPFGNQLTMPPLSNGQTVFYSQAGGPLVAVDSPNNGSGQVYLMFYKNDSTGTSYETQFGNLVATGGTINVTQNGQTASYASNTPGVFYLDNSGFLVFNASIQTVTVANPFNYTDPISLSFS